MINTQQIDKGYLQTLELSFYLMLKDVTFPS